MKTTIKRIGIAVLSCLALTVAAAEDDTVVADAKETVAVAEVEPWYGFSMALGDWHLPADRHRHVYGLYLDPTPLPFYGEHYEMTGLSVNLFAGLETRMRGIQVSGFFGKAANGVYGIQIAGLSASTGRPVVPLADTFLNYPDEDEMCGLQAAFWAASSTRLYGVQAAGLAAVAGEEMRGVQLGLLAASKVSYGVQASLLFALSEEMHGVQIAPISMAKRASGLQVGLFNVVERTTDDGVLVQLGLINCVRDAHSFPILNVAW